MSSPVCVDASFVLTLVLAEEFSDQALAQWSTWVAEDTEVIAPCHLEFETTSVLRNYVHRHLLSAAAGQLAFEALQALDVTLVHPDGLTERAWTLAQRFNRPTAYDACYLALGEMADCHLWTADRRLYQAVHDTLPWVKCLG